MDFYNFDTKRVVGRGAFGTVYLVERKKDHREVIMKQIPVDDLTTNQRRDVMNEIHVLSLLHHPNIIEYNEYFVEGKAFMIVMEYAQGGNLFDYLQQRHTQNCLLEEEEILKFFGQITRGLHHIHLNKILHRDMKTHNILLDKKRKVAKICDFGISKIFSQTMKADTAVGTPHYLSPEICSGSRYNQKSDIWSLGCILYELISLQRAFEAENFSAIVAKIVKRKFSPMPNHYSSDLKKLVTKILVLEPAQRPSIEEIMSEPVVINSLLDLETDIGRIPCGFPHRSNPSYKRANRSTSGSPLNPSDKKRDSNSPRTLCISTKDDLIRRTISFTAWDDEASRLAAEELTSAVYSWGNGVILPTALPLSNMDQFIVQVCAGRSKKLGLTSNGRVISWEVSADSKVGSPRDSQASIPTVPKFIGDLSGSTIAQVCCGDHFSAALTDRGMLMTWGQGVHGCLGHGDTKDTKPKIVEALVGYTVVQISCGAAHVLALTHDNHIYAWGHGGMGRLGLGDTEDRRIPTLVPLPPNIVPKFILCGSDCSFIITADNTVLATGSNRDNKIAVLNEEELESDCSSMQVLHFSPITVKPISSEKIVWIATGTKHSAFLTEAGRVITSGSNGSNQLGYMKDADDLLPRVLEVLSCEKITLLGCGDAFTVAVTADNKVYTWGHGKRGRLGRNEVGDCVTPSVIAIPVAPNTSIKIHSLSVCQSMTMIAAQIVELA